MHGRITAQLVAIAVVALTPTWALAQDAKKPVPPNPVGAGGAWSQTVNKEAAIAGKSDISDDSDVLASLYDDSDAMADIRARFGCNNVSRTAFQKQ